MGTLLLNKIKKQASCFLQEKYRNARIAFTDVTAAELLTEDATNSDPWGPDVRTMTKISEASFNMNDYWRIVHIIPKRLNRIEWKHWRQFYKTLVLLEFLLTHGPTTFADEFMCDYEGIEELGTFTHVDENGFDWGLNMQKRSDKVLELLQGGETLRQSRLKALKTSKEITGFGNSASTSPSSSSDSSRASNSSFGSFFTSASTPQDIIHDHLIDDLEIAILVKSEEDSFLGDKALQFPSSEDENLKCLHLWDCPPIPEKGSLMESDYHRGEKNFPKSSAGFITDICSKLGIRTKNDAANVIKNKFGRQLSLRF
ncbi:COP1-interacting protein-related, putative isoform 1 [Hibiscus syriacus]|uniref:COP1-interacting protein-related, putative isoform 1 n=1 Tax=Hibiscus syriacus TaxID=106335 RepID=A0A6A3D9G5_HIBSY|nr:COP1-interacting protein-related, putative isoform 1 [Hibiscus syriacus]